MTESVRFHPVIQTWFAEKVGEPTEVQRQVWPRIAAGAHVLATAPTGSGKTLAAFLWAIAQFLNGAWTPGQIRVLYISPLKALNNDIRRNLLLPLKELRQGWEAAAGAAPWPAMSVMTRSGDTPGSERQRMLHKPPEFLITTPESLNLLISSPRSRRLLSGVQMVILDEIHALVGQKRGTHLMTAVERLTLLCGEFQRVALSATIKPLQEVAHFIGGYTLSTKGGGPSYARRPVDIIETAGSKTYQLRVSIPESLEQKSEADSERQSFWHFLADDLKPIIENNSSTLIFANSRRLTEKLTRFINQGEARNLAYAHHGSLSREIRLVVEKRLKQGELKSIVATNSLELGIDVGALSMVLLVQTPASVSAAIQRVGRAGHQVGAVSRGRFFPLPGRDIIDAAVAARAVLDGSIEAVKVVKAPLDVLAQVILAMVGNDTWKLDGLYDFLRTCAPYHRLSRENFDRVIDMLAGRYADSRLRPLTPRVYLDGVDGTIAGRPGMLRLVYLAGGTIPDRGYYNLRFQDSKAKIGELDEEFVWERALGDTFTLGTHTWRIQRITHNDVEVVPTEARPSIIPFWRAEQQNRDFHLSEKIACFLEGMNDRLEEAGLAGELTESHRLDPGAALELINYLKRQRQATGTALPHRHHLLVEHFCDPLNRSESKQVILHTLWGGKVNQPLALAISSAWKEKYGHHLEIFHNNDSILLLLPHSFITDELFSLVTPENVHELLRKKLSSTGLFGAFFRENAARALLLPRANFKKRLPLWLNRLRSKKLLEAMARHEEFPILLETWRTCFEDVFDLETLERILMEVLAGEIALGEAFTETASPFTDGLLWRMTNKYMYEDDTPHGRNQAALSEGLLQELVNAPQFRARLDTAVIDAFTSKAARTAPGYSPGSPRDLILWIKERLFLPAAEWEVLLAAMLRDHQWPEEEVLTSVADRIVFISRPSAVSSRDGLMGVCALEMLPRLRGVLNLARGGDDIRSIEKMHLPAAGELARLISEMMEAPRPGPGADDETEGGHGLTAFLAEWLRFYGPLSAGFIKGVLDLSAAGWEEALGALLDSKTVVAAPLIQGVDEQQFCDSENLEILLRLTRKRRRPQFKALPLEQLPLFLARHQGLLANNGEALDGLKQALTRLFGYPARARAWEEWILPARLSPYHLAWMDSLMQESDLLWFGCGRECLSFTFPEDLELFMTQLQPQIQSREQVQAQSRERVPDSGPLAPGGIAELMAGRHFFTFEDAQEVSKLGSEELLASFWEEIWAGRLTNENFLVLRRGIEQDFKPLDRPSPPSEFSSQRRRRRPSTANRWRASRPFSGTWRLLARDSEGSGPSDPLDALEDNKDRVRQLLERYGLLFKELLAWELPALRWSALFRALRLMELSGEVLSGYFFEDIPGLQFMSHEAFRSLAHPLSREGIYWLNATDPASCCGLRLPGLQEALPKRLPSTFLVYKGSKVVLIARAGGRQLELFPPPEHPELLRYLEVFKVLMNRQFRPARVMEVETINGKPAWESPYLPALKAFGFVKEYKSLLLRKQF